MVDEFGVDPLREPVYSLLSGEYATHTVKTTEVNNPQLLAKRYYGAHSFFHVILSYNGLVHQSELVAGLTIRIPKIDNTRKVTTQVYEF